MHTFMASRTMVMEILEGWSRYVSMDILEILGSSDDVTLCSMASGQQTWGFIR
jgi:hypothetical protein